MVREHAPTLTSTTNACTTRTANRVPTDGG